MTRLVHDDDWRSRGACDTDTIPIFDRAADGDPRAVREAITICARCPDTIRTQCAAEADRHGEVGVWAGQQNARDRAEMERRAAAARRRREAEEAFQRVDLRAARAHAERLRVAGRPVPPSILAGERAYNAARTMLRRQGGAA